MDDRSKYIDPNVQVDSLAVTDDVVICDEVQVDQVVEKTDGAGVTVEEALIKDDTICVREMIIDEITGKSGPVVCFSESEFKQGVSVCGQLNRKNIAKPLTADDTARRSMNGASPAEQYDLIIVGAGTSGSLLVYRLAQQYPTKKILLLDVGQDDNRIDDDSLAAVPNPNPDGGEGRDAWGQATRTIISGFGEGCGQWQDEIKTLTTERNYDIPIQNTRGATLGGTSAFNFVVWNRGTKEGTYDRWEAATGDSAFGNTAMTEAFKKIENRTQATRYYGQTEDYWEVGSPDDFRNINSNMGTDPSNRLFVTQAIFPSGSGQAIENVLTTTTLPGRDGPLRILSDVTEESDIEYIEKAVSSLYDQSDPAFPARNPYKPTDPGLTYIPPADNSNAKGPEFATFTIRTNEPSPPNVPKSIHARCYAAPAYLYPILDDDFPHNVTIKQRAYVTKLLFDPVDPTEVIGVEWVEGTNGEGWHVAQVNRAIDRSKAPYKNTISGGLTTDLIDRRELCSFNSAVKNQQTVTYHEAYAKADVWLCAGAIDSAAIMLRSGIGPREKLESLRSDPVECRVNLPGVGHAAQDTLDIAPPYFTEIDLGTGLPNPFPAAIPELLLDEILGAADPTNLDNPAGSAGITGAANAGFSTPVRVRSDPSKPFPDADILFGISGALFGVGSYTYDDIARISSGRKLSIDTFNTKPVFDRARWGYYTPAPVSVIHLATPLIEFWDAASQGEVSINSGNPFERANYAPNMGADEADLEALGRLFENTVVPTLTRNASQRQGYRGIATYAGVATAGSASSITLGSPFGTNPVPLKPIATNIDGTTYDTPTSLDGYFVTLRPGLSTQEIRPITAWAGSGTYVATVPPWSTAPVGGENYLLNPPGAFPLDVVEMNDDNSRNFARFTNSLSEAAFSPVVAEVLATDPLTTSTGSTRVTVNHPSHGFETHDYIKMSGVTAAVNGIDAVHFNDYHIVYKIDNDNYDIILFWNRTPIGGPGSAPEPSPAASATAGAGGGSTVEIHTLRFDEGKFREWVRTHYFSGWHACCTCRMGKEDDSFAVVDTRARVYNTKGLRVCDCSIFPVKPNANTQAPAYGIAQRIFELVSAEEYDTLL